MEKKLRVALLGGGSWGLNMQRGGVAVPLGNSIVELLRDASTLFGGVEFAQVRFAANEALVASAMLLRDGDVVLVLTREETALFICNGVVQTPGVYGSSDPSGRITGTGTLTVGGTSPYTTWANSFLPGNNVSNPAGDNDNDGLTNQQEFAFGLSPISGSSVNPILVQLNKTTGQFSYQRRASSGLTYKVLTSTTLAAGSWTQDVTASQVAGVTDGNGTQTVVVTLTGAPLAASKLFVRVSAE